MATRKKATAPAETFIIDNLNNYIGFGTYAEAVAELQSRVDGGDYGTDTSYDWVILKVVGRGSYGVAKVA